MARVPEREVIRLRKEVAIMRCELNRQTMAADLDRIRASLSWAPAAMGAAKLAAPVLALLAPFLLRKSRKADRPPRRRSTLRRALSGGLFCWRAFRNLRSMLGGSAGRSRE